MPVRYRFLALVLWMAPIAAAHVEESLAPEEVDTSTQPALTIDRWRPRPTPTPAPAPSTPPSAPAAPPKPLPPADIPPPVAPVVPVPAAPPPVPVPPRAASPAPAGTGLPAAARAAMNAMTGTLSSLDLGAQTIRLTIDGDINPQIA